MAVRQIDGNELYRIEKLLDTDIVRQDKVALNLLEQVLYDIQHVPTLTPPNEPLTQDDVNEMHFDRVWIDYGTDEHGKRDGEEGIVLYGKLYSIDTLDGAGLEDMILDATGHGGDTLDNPSGNYTVYRRPPEGEDAK